MDTLALESLEGSKPGTDSINHYHVGEAESLTLSHCLLACMPEVVCQWNLILGTQTGELGNKLLGPLVTAWHCLQPSWQNRQTLDATLLPSCGSVQRCQVVASMLTETAWLLSAALLHMILTSAVMSLPPACMVAPLAAFVPAIDALVAKLHVQVGKVCTSACTRDVA